jgi:Putative metallopeptidase
MTQNFRKNIANFVLILAVFVFIFGCACPNERSGRDFNDDEQKTVANNETDSTKIIKENKNSPLDKGDFVVEYATVSNDRYDEIDKQIKTERVLEKAASDLNKSISLPTDVTLRTKDCGDVNAFYDPKDASITICYELMERFFKLFKSTGENDEKAYDSMFDAIRFVFLHELGHALIDLHEIPVAGSEEDAADRLSTYICLEELGDEGARSAIAAAEAFDIESKNAGGDDLAFYDNHKLGQQRFYDIVCSLYGYDSDKYSGVVKKGLLPKERAVSCKSEYDRLQTSWGKLLKPLRK